MLTDAEIRHLTVPEKLFTYADAYLRAATILTRQMTVEPCSWSDGAVVLMLSAHATELFLKAMLLSRDPELPVWKQGHDIDGLAGEFRAMFPEPQFAWDVPFSSKYPEDFTPEDIAALAPLEDDHPSILYRYPLAKGGMPWNGLYGFEPHSLLQMLLTLTTEFFRLRSALPPQ